MSPALVGIFVGGKARRMAGAAKGLLLSPQGEPLVLRLSRVARLALGDVRIVLVGRAGDYEHLHFESLADEPGDVGPLGGLSALLSEAQRSGAEAAFALAGDMPYLDAPLLARLSRHAPRAAAVAPRSEHRWEPLCARYEPGAAGDVARNVLRNGGRALHAVFDALGPLAVELPVDEAERMQLRDWDTAEDIARK